MGLPLTVTVEFVRVWGHRWTPKCAGKVTILKFRRTASWLSPKTTRRSVALEIEFRGGEHTQLRHQRLQVELQHVDLRQDGLHLWKTVQKVWFVDSSLVFKPFRLQSRTLTLERMHYTCARQPVLCVKLLQDT